MIDDDLKAELKSRGRDSVRALLAASSDAFSGTARNTSINLGNRKVQRADLEDWLNYQDRATAIWVKAGVIFAFIAAVCSLLDLLTRL